jgi:hypothetical protein
MKIHSLRVDEQQIKAFVEHGKHLRKILLPVFEDLQFRLAFRLLPVRSRFWFLEPSHPGIRVCMRAGCNAIETEQHLFFDCTLASQLWRQVLQLVLPFFVSRPSWFDIALANKLRVRDDWDERMDVVRDVWHALRAVTLHTIWTDRNRCLFDGRQPMPAAPALSVTFSTFCAHIRFFQRHLYDQEESRELQRVIDVMKTHSVFRDFAGQRPGIASVRSSS